MISSNEQLIMALTIVLSRWRNSQSYFDLLSSFYESVSVIFYSHDNFMFRNYTLLSVESKKESN